MTKNVQEILDKLKIDSRVWDLQKIGLLGMSRILRKVLEHKMPSIYYEKQQDVRRNRCKTE